MSLMLWHSQLKYGMASSVDAAITIFHYGDCVFR